MKYKFQKNHNKHLMIHKSTTEKQKKQLHDSKGDNIQLLHSGDQTFKFKLSAYSNSSI